MKKQTILMAALLLTVVCAVSAQGKSRLAILPFTGNNADDAETIAEFFSYEDGITENFTVVPRTSAIENIMKEQEFQRSGLTDSDTISKLGHQMNADYVLAGHITTLGTRKLLLITIVHVEELRQIAGDYKEYTQIDETLEMLPSMAKRIAEAARRDTARLPRLAVLPFNAQTSGVNEGDAEVLAQILATDITNSGKYAVFPRTKAVETVMKEHNIERSGMTDPDNIRRIGVAVNAQYVLSANFRNLNNNSRKFFSAQILDIEDARQTEGSYEEYRTVSDGLTLMAKLSATLTGTNTAPPAPAIPAGFVRVAGGTFLMGSNNGENNEKPVHTVTVKSYHIGKYEVTQKEWTEIMGNNPSTFKGDNRPVENVSWYDAVEYCNRRSQKEGLTQAYRSTAGVIICDFNASGYRLPTEAEWEFAAKGGNKDLMEYTYSGSNNAGSVAWYEDNSGGSTHEVGTKAANSLGIYDMSGNVWEWCWDWYGSYGSGPQTDPVGASSGSRRVFRGGSWFNSAASIRSASWGHASPSHGGIFGGFRLVRPDNAKVTDTILNKGAVVSAVSAQKKESLAVFSFTGGNAAVGDTIASSLTRRTELRNAFNRTILITRNTIAAMNFEQRFQRNSGLTDADTIFELGKAINAAYVIAGYITTFSDRNLVVVSIMDVENLQQIAGDYRTYKTIDEIDALIPEMAQKLAAAVSRDTSNLPGLSVPPFVISSEVNENDAMVLAQILACDLANSGKYAVLPRTDSIAKVLEEHQRGVGRNADFVLSGSVQKLGNINKFTANILNIATRVFHEGGEERYSNFAEGLTNVSRLAALLSAQR